MSDLEKRTLARDAGNGDLYAALRLVAILWREHTGAVVCESCGKPLSADLRCTGSVYDCPMKLTIRTRVIPAPRPEREPVRNAAMPARRKAASAVNPRRRVAQRAPRTRGAVRGS